MGRAAAGGGEGADGATAAGTQQNRSVNYTTGQRDGFSRWGGPWLGLRDEWAMLLLMAAALCTPGLVGGAETSHNSVSAGLGGGRRNFVGKMNSLTRSRGSYDAGAVLSGSFSAVTMSARLALGRLGRADHKSVQALSVLSASAHTDARPPWAAAERDLCSKRRLAPRDSWAEGLAREEESRSLELSRKPGGCSLARCPRLRAPLAARAASSHLSGCEIQAKDTVPAEDDRRLRGDG